jgi:DNA-binding GntR family transcriptional regulator
MKKAAPARHAGAAAPAKPAAAVRTTRTRETPLGGGEKRVPRAEQAYQEIRRAIRQRRFRAGDRLRENDLAELLGLSRTPVREALSRLQAEGLAAENSQRGFTIIEFDHAMVAELYTMREVLEGTAARLAARSAAHAEVDLLRELHGQYARLVEGGSGNALAEKNRQFHEALCRCAHNRFLLRMLEPLHDALGLLGESNLADPQRALENVSDHAAIVEALARRDETAAESLARAHIRAAHTSRIKRMFAGA